MTRLPIPDTLPRADRGGVTAEEQAEMLYGSSDDAPAAAAPPASAPGREAETAAPVATRESFWSFGGDPRPAARKGSGSDGRDLQLSVDSRKDA
jgi:hypothetical protein